MDTSDLAQNHTRPRRGKTSMGPEPSLSKLTFTLLDPTTGKNSWTGIRGATLDIKLSVASPKAVYMLMNTRYGQNGIPNVLVKFVGTGLVSRVYRLIGNSAVRDYNNWVWTNTVNGTSSQEWWTNNASPRPQDQSHREDVHRFAIGQAFAGQTLSEITVKAPTGADVHYMQPLLFAIGVDAGIGSGTLPSTCSTQ